MAADTILVISEEQIDFVIQEATDLNFSLSDLDNLSFSLVESDDLSYVLDDSDDLSFSIGETDNIGFIIEEQPEDLVFALEDIVIFIGKSEDLENVAIQYTSRVDFVGDTIIYKGEALPGALETDSLWRIRKIEFVGTDVFTTWASGNENLDKIWNNRLSYIYS